ADGLSRQFTGIPKRKGDGHESDVNPDWEAEAGIVNDLFSIEEDDEYGGGWMSPFADYTALRTRFAEEPIFAEVIDAFLDLDTGKTIREKRRARHRAIGYFIDEGRLWRLGDGRSSRARPRVECVTRKEAVALAAIEHGERGHWGRDLVKIQMLDRMWSPGLDQSITTAI
ncbi:hypothetical protein FIBSPDRAFT_706190, partial [Athelia psychrophila]